jgi:hypothetical protein
MAHHEDLSEADRLIADCMNYIAPQREIITIRYEQDLSNPPKAPIRKSRLPSGQQAERNRSETRLRGWGGRTRTRKCRQQIIPLKDCTICENPVEFWLWRLFAFELRVEDT